MAVISAIPDAKHFEWSPDVGSLRLSLARYTLPDLAFQLNRIGQHLEAQPASDGPRVGLPVGTPSMRWVIAECFRLATMWAAKPRNGNLKLPQASTHSLVRILKKTMHLLCSTMQTDGDVLETSGISDFIFPIVAPQFKAARTSPLRVGQALWMFEEAAFHRQAREPKFPAKELTAAFQKTLGMSVREFISIVLLAFGRSSGPNPILNLMTWSDNRDYERFRLGTLTTGGIIHPRVSDLFRVMGGTAFEFETWCRKQTGKAPKDIHDIDVVNGPNPLSEFPLILPFHENRSVAIAPVPYLLLEWLHEPMARVLKDSLPKELQTPFDLLFEEYVGMVLNRHRPGDSKWIPASDLNNETSDPGRVESTVDFVRTVQGHVVLVDAKPARVWPISRHRLRRSDWEGIHAKVYKAISQAKSTYKIILQGRVSGVSSNTTRNPVLLVVTHGDTSLMGFDREFWSNIDSKVSNEFPSLQVVVVSIDELHWLATGWLSHNDDWFIQMLLSWREQKNQQLGNRIPQATGPLFSAISEVFPADALAAATHVQRARE